MEINLEYSIYYNSLYLKKILVIYKKIILKYMKQIADCIKLSQVIFLSFILSFFSVTRSIQSCIDCAISFCQPLNRKVLYHFAIFTIVNKILIIKNCRILVLNNFFTQILSTLQKNCKRQKTFSSHRTLRIFSEFFINFLVLYFLIFTNI